LKQLRKKYPYKVEICEKNHLLVYKKWQRTSTTRSCTLMTAPANYTSVSALTLPRNQASSPKSYFWDVSFFPYLTTNNIIDTNWMISKKLAGLCSACQWKLPNLTNF
jgi:hypothetical protein